MDHDVLDISALRAKIAKRMVELQVHQACEKRSASGRLGDLNPKEPPPGLRGLELDKIEEHEPVRVSFAVGVVGAGMAGLYASLILQDLDLQHDVIEASSRPGGRVHTRRFTPNEGDYFELGAMLFPDIPIMSRTWRLLKLLHIEKNTSPRPQQGSLIPYHFTGPRNPMLFNNILFYSTCSESSSEEAIKKDIFKVGCRAGGRVDDEFVRIGPLNLLKGVFDQWKTDLVRDFDTTWDKLMKLDSRATSLRTYMIGRFSAKFGDDTVGPYYLTNWCETMTGGTGHFDMSFVSWLLLSLEFDYPSAVPPIYDTMPCRGGCNPTWWILNGGSDIVAKRLEANLAKKPLYNHRVNKISRSMDELTVTMQPVYGRQPIQKTYSHVITTTTTPCLGFMDLREAGLGYAHREGIRVMSYDGGVKVGIKFSRRWWAEDRDITRGGTGKTDRPTRIVIYPSHALDTPRGEPGVLIACFNWGQDASRLGCLAGNLNTARSRQAAGEQHSGIFDAVMADLAAMHEYPEEELRRMVLDYDVQDWEQDPLANGHFPFLAPGQFSSLFGEIQVPAANGRLFLAGEVASIYHGWIVAALNSAYWGIHKMLMCELVRRARHEETNKGELAYILKLLRRLKENWGCRGDDPEDEYDGDPKGMAGWQAFLGVHDWET